MGDAGSLPRSFTVPRDTRLVEVVACDWDQLRRVRTELELLRRIRRCVLRGFAASVRVDRGASDRYSPAAREELASILCDACHPVVDETLASIDRQFGRLRREIVMSAVNEEAQNIVQEGVESGAIDPGSMTPDAPNPTESSDGTGSADIQEALAQAEAALAEAATGVAPETLPTPQQPNECSPNTDAIPESVEAEEALCETDVAEPSSSEPEALSECPPVEPTDSADPVDTTDSAETPHDNDAPQDLGAGVPEQTTGEVSGSDTPAETPEDPTEIAASTEAHNAAADLQPTSDDAEAFDASFTPERAERAVEEIERGIRKLASVLSTEVSEKWTHANTALQEVAQTGTRIEEVHAKALQALSDLNRLKDEAQIARMEADVARREAKLFREDAKRAKQRAETSAAAAELSADQATRDAHAAAGTRT